MCDTCEVWASINGMLNHLKILKYDWRGRIDEMVLDSDGTLCRIVWPPTNTIRRHHHSPTFKDAKRIWCHAHRVGTAHCRQSQRSLLLPPLPPSLLQLLTHCATSTSHDHSTRHEGVLENVVQCIHEENVLHTIENLLNVGRVGSRRFLRN